jgi:hypothetical protein
MSNDGDDARFDEPAIGRLRAFGCALVILHDQFYWMPGDAAGGVDFLHRHLDTIAFLNSQLGLDASQLSHKANRDGRLSATARETGSGYPNQRNHQDLGLQ